MHRRLGELQAAVAAHGVDDVDEQRLGDGVAGEPDERVDDLLGVVPGGPGVPQGQRGDAVGVDVLGRAFELREGGDRRAGLPLRRMVDLEQQGLVGLDDQGPVGRGAFLPTTPAGAGRWKREPVASRQPRPDGPGTSARTHRHAGGARGGERSIGLHSCTENARMPRRSYRAPPAIALPERACRDPEWSASGRPADRPVPTRRSDGSADDSDAPRAAPSFSAPVLPAPACGSGAPQARHPPRAERTSARVRKPSVPCPSAAGRHRQSPCTTRAGGRGRDQHRDRTLVVGPPEPAQLAAGVEARRRRAGARAARDRARRAPRRGPGADGLRPGYREPAARGPRPRRGHGGRAARRARPGGAVRRRAAPRRPRPAAGRRPAHGRRLGADPRGSPTGIWTRRPRPRCRRPRAASPSCPCCAATSTARERRAGRPALHRDHRQGGRAGPLAAAAADHPEVIGLATR